MPIVAVLLSVVVVVLIAAAFVWFIGQLPMFDASLLNVARAVMYLCVGAYALFAVVGLFTGHTYVPLLPIK